MQGRFTIHDYVGINTQGRSAGAETPKTVAVARLLAQCPPSPGFSPSSFVMGLPGRAHTSHPLDETQEGENH